MLFNDYPAIKAATLEIAYDNGAINVTTSESDHLRDREFVLREAIAAGTADSIEKELAALSKDQLFDLCCGEEGTVETSELVGEFLNAIFDKQGN